MLSIIVSFSCIYVSQGSVVTQLTHGSIFNNHSLLIVCRMHQWKKFWKSVNIWWRYRQSQVGRFL